MSVASGDYTEASSAYDENELEADDEIVDAQIYPGDGEKTKILTMFDDLRRESTFCDVAFLCKGKLFRAHRIVVSGWSRWLRALLSEGSSEEVVHLDVFDPIAFGNALDYMYGCPITVTVDNAEPLLKVIRRLELHGLEQSMWIFLMKAIDNHNCNQLHELADRYDCPPLKLAAWRYIQKSISGPSKHQDEALRKVHKGTGLTGPGEAGFYRNVTLQETLNTERELADVIRGTAGVITSHLATEPRKASAEEGGDEEDKSQEDVDSQVDLNEDINTNMNSVEFVRAWSKRLQAVYRDCTVDPNDIHQNEAAIAAGQRSVVLSSRPKQKRQAEGHTSPSRENRAPSASKDSVPRGNAHQLTPGDIDWHSELKGFYLGINMPEKLPFIDDMLQSNAGKEEQMLSHIMMKYKRVIPESLANHLDTLQGFLESHSDYHFAN
eukprot:GSChrysophyteH1.ASY1.ANO1.2344.1 assembled CDS